MPTTKIEGVHFNKDGTTEFVFEDVGTVHLRRPKIREFRELREEVLTLRRQQTNGVDADDLSDDEAVEEVVRKTTPEERAASEDRILDWYDLVFRTLAKGPLPEIEREDYPVWIFDARNIPEMLQHWMERPTVPGR